MQNTREGPDVTNRKRRYTVGGNKGDARQTKRRGNNRSGGYKTRE